MVKPHPLLLPLVLIVTVILPPSPLRAADPATIITVTTTADELFSDGDCSLREAIQAANENQTVDQCAGGGAVDLIQLTAGLYTLTLAGGDDTNERGDLDIRSNLTINGAGARTTIIDGNGLGRVIHLPVPQASVAINDVTITNGRAGDGGGIYNQGTMTLARSVVHTNQTEYWGGGVYNSGVLTVTDSIIGNNHSVNFNGEGGGIANDGTLTMTNSAISGNSALRYAGGFANREGTATLTAVTINNNRTAEQGGGILNGGGATLVINHSTLQNNQAGLGGAISTFGSLTLLNSTISGNQADYGAGIFLQLNTVRLNHSTISANRAIGAAGILSGFRGRIVLANSIVANQQQGEDCLNPDGVIKSEGHNLDSDQSCRLNAASDLPGGAANLGPLQDNGGATWTHALLPSSAAIDQGDCLGATLTADQRGVARPQGSQCDIGSFETTGAALDFSITPEVQTIVSGATATFTLTITNTGSITLTTLGVVDQTTPACDRVVDVLAPLSIINYSCSRSDVPASFIKRVVVTATTTAVADRVHAQGTATVKLVGWSDLFLPVATR